MSATIQSDKRWHLGHALSDTGNEVLFVGRKGAVEAAYELNMQDSKKLFKTEITDVFLLIL